MAPPGRAAARVAEAYSNKLEVESVASMPAFDRSGAAIPQCWPRVRDNVRTSVATARSQPLSRRSARAVRYAGLARANSRSP